MKKLAIGLLVVLTGIAAVGLATLPAMTYTASAQTASTGAFADSDFAAASGTASSRGPSGSSAGFVAVCPSFVAIGGTCSESAP
jgi:hypothetical protein